MPLVIPVFIPHEGCPHRCVFCNQRRISGQAGGPVRGRDVVRTVTTWLARAGDRPGGQVQVAFYGGSFTALEPVRQEELLAAVAPFLAKGLVGSLRLSTRPDAVDPERLALLGRHGVTLVELGVQSMDDRVLARAGRGHDSEAVVRAVRLLREASLQVGLQLLPGLPGETRRSLMRTVERIIGLRPDMVRIYPALVLAGSPLARMYRQGRYRPLTLAGAVVRVAWMKSRFAAAGIRVVRMGLQAGPALEDALVAGPWHPAFGELVESRRMLRRTRQVLARVPAGEQVLLSISSRDQSLFRGQRSANIRRLARLGLADRFVLRLDPEQPRFTLRCLGQGPGARGRNRRRRRPG